MVAVDSGTGRVTVEERTAHPGTLRERSSIDPGSQRRPLGLKAGGEGKLTQVVEGSSSQDIMDGSKLGTQYGELPPLSSQQCWREELNISVAGSTEGRGTQTSTVLLSVGPWQPPLEKEVVTVTS